MCINFLNLNNFNVQKKEKSISYFKISAKRYYQNIPVHKDRVIYPLLLILQ